MLCQEDGTVSWLNPPGRVMLGEEALGSDFCSVLVPEDGAGGIAALRDKVAREGEWTYPARAHGPGGGEADVLVHLRMAPLPGELGKALLLAIFHERAAAGPEGSGSLAPERQMEIAVPANHAALVALISRYLLNLPFNQVENGVLRALAAVGRAGGCGRAYLFMLSPDGTAVDRVWEWTARDVKPHDLSALQGMPVSRFPWSMRYFLAGREVAVVDGHVLPPEAEAERISCETLGVWAYLNAPVLLRGRLVGWIGLDSVEAPRIWSSAEVGVLRTVGGLLTSAVYGADQEQELARERERSNLILDCVGEAVICADDSGRVSFLNPAAERLTGWTRDEAIGRAASEVVALRPEGAPDERLDPLTVPAANHDLVLVDRWAREVPVLLTVADLEDEGSGRVLALRDVTEARRAAQEVRHHASHDPLTGLVNRREFELRLGRAAQGAEDRSVQHALCFLDLDHFKQINDTAGHAAGDAALREVSRLIRGNLRSRDTLARIGGDEFGLLLEDCSVDDAWTICRSLVDSLGGFRFQWSGERFPVGVSIGMTRVTGKADPSELLTEADRACLRAKYHGRGRVELYDPDQEVTALSLRERLTAAALRHAVDNGGLVLFWQPVLPLQAHDDRPLYREVLTSLPRRDGSLMPAESFLPIARRHGLMAMLDRQVISAAMTRWAAAGKPAPLAMNLSREALCDARLVPDIERLIADTGAAPGELWFEIREAAWEARLTEARMVASQLHGLGSRIVLDDCRGSFGCLDHLDRGGFSALKVDARQLGHLVADGRGIAMLRALSSAAHSMGVHVIAQKVPEPAALAVLAEAGVDFVQARILRPPEPLPST